MIVFRGSASAPNSVFVAGFSPHNTSGGKGIVVTKGGQMFGGVSTSKSVEIAMKYAAGYSSVGAYVYAIYLAPDVKYIDIVEYFDRKISGCCSCFGGKEWQAGYNNVEEHQEVSFEKILPEHVIAGRKIETSSDGMKVHLSRQVSDTIQSNPRLDSSIPQNDLKCAEMILKDTTKESSTYFSF